MAHPRMTSHEPTPRPIWKPLAIIGFVAGVLTVIFLVRLLR